MDYELMPPFEYDLNRTRAMVKFQAHKFPYTSSVYYQCNVRLCLRNGGCDEVTQSLFKKKKLLIYIPSYYYSLLCAMLKATTYDGSVKLNP